MIEHADPREKFVDLIDLRSCRVLLAPHLTFICGGPVDIRVLTNHSVRNMFMNYSARDPEKSKGFVLAENFKDWKDAYTSLSDFENDIAAISSLIVVILESAGSLAELGLFYANSALRSKLIVIVHSDHHKSESFIKFGLLNPMEDMRTESVLVYDINVDKVEEIKTSEIEEIVGEVFHISGKIEKSTAFNVENRGHLIFLIYQIVDLFTILTLNEISTYLERVGVNLDRKKLNSALYILQKFGLIVKEKRSSQFFFFAPPDVENRVELSFKHEVQEDGHTRRYDSRAIKVQILEHYRKNKSKNLSFSRRLNLWNKLQGEQS
ncbi:retron St85 family effector protein [Leisingera sp. D0M16]|uniref:retron St85 family effector protein n=1 Tax=Leisingera coralii TaxID=3351347 RepID=UPI003B7C48E7